MTDQRASDPAEAPLDFDRAQFSNESASVTTCAACNQPLSDEYFQVNGVVTCRACRERIEIEVTGSPPYRFLLASALGVGAGLLGCGIYWLVGWLTGYEFGLIAIVVGFLVGTAVRAGSRRRGGLPYQLLAMGLTYAAIAGTNVPAILTELAKPRPGDTAVVGQASTAAPNTTDTAPPTGAAPVARYVLYGVFVFALAMALPFLAGLENLLGIIIIAIGLYEAWKLNPRFRLEVTGPYHVATVSPSAGAALT